MASQNLRINQIVSYDYSKENGCSGTWKIIAKEETRESKAAPSWAGKDYRYTIQNQNCGRKYSGIRRKDLNSKSDPYFAESL